MKINKKGVMIPGGTSIEISKKKSSLIKKK